MGIRETNCLNIVKEKINKKSFHVLSQADINNIEELLSSAVDNDGKTTPFPDFISSNGFIEHFEVSSGKMTRKGYYNKRKRSDIEKNNTNTLDQNQNQPLSSSGFIRDNEGVELFNKSFIEKWNKHIDSLHKYTGSKHFSCFLIQSDDVIYTALNPRINDQYASINYEIGNLLENHIDYPHFYISHNIELLDFIQNYSDEVDYCIFINGFGELDIIHLKKIPIIKNILSGYNITHACGLSLEICHTIRL